jgi:hypothetical protein
MRCRHPDHHPCEPLPGATSLPSSPTPVRPPVVADLPAWNFDLFPMAPATLTSLISPKQAPNPPTPRRGEEEATGGGASSLPEELAIVGSPNMTGLQWPLESGALWRKTF